MIRETIDSSFYEFTDTALRLLPAWEDTPGRQSRLESRRHQAAAYLIEVTKDLVLQRFSANPF
jgi:hypothetical protein